MNCRNISFSGHAIRRMFERGIIYKDVLEVTKNGEVIKDYPDDVPYPSFLILGFIKDLPLHVVVGMESQTKTCYVITAYQADPDLWDVNFKTRRPS
jgi:hypothetical protein